MRKLQSALLACSLILLSFPFAAAQSPPNATREPYAIDRYLNIRNASSPALSPKGDRLAFLTNITGTPQVWMVDARGGWPEQLTFYTDRVDFVEWSPDGAHLIFGKAVGGNENAQLYLLTPDGSSVKALTDAPKIRHNFGAWSHDGKRISYGSNKRDPNFFDVYTMDVATGREELVYQQNGSNQPVAWSFDDGRIVVSHESDQLSLDNDLYLVDLATKQATPLTPHEGAAQFGSVRFTRDGRALLLATNNNREFYSLARMDLQNKKIEIVDETPHDLAGAAISDDGSWLAYTINRDGFSELYVRKVDASGKLNAKPAPVTLPGKGVAGGLEFSKDNRKLAFVFNGARYNSDVWLYDTAARSIAQVTHSSRAGIPQSSFIEPELIRYKSFDGREIPAWYYRPQDTTFLKNGNKMTGIVSGKNNLPVIVSVHGGPEGQEAATFNGSYQYFLQRGYAILAPNVRGSTGYGKTFTHLDDVRKREDSVKDLAAAVEWLKTTGGADPKRIAVMGGSYGGYMTLAAITLYPDLWAAAVEMFGIANFETNLTNTSGYRRKQREREYGTLAGDLDFLKSISPIYKVDRIRSPLLVFQGRNDPRVPYTEAEQIVKALRDRNAPVEYTLFPDEGHGFVKLPNRIVVYSKVADFLDRYMKQTP
ncbi:MAG: alpha/beta fold hydrolase [Pyrinomonadaceae bacterium]